jgi:hypothetical protein
MTTIPIKRAQVCSNEKELLPPENTSGNVENTAMFYSLKVKLLCYFQNCVIPEVLSLKCIYTWKLSLKGKFVGIFSLYILIVDISVAH